MSDPKVGEWRAFRLLNGAKGIGKIQQYGKKFFQIEGQLKRSIFGVSFGPLLDPTTLLDFTPHTPELVAFEEEKAARTCLDCRYLDDVSYHPVCIKGQWPILVSTRDRMRRAATCEHFERVGDGE